jgi:hypothetical protein
MATVINTPATRDTSESAAAGWAVAVIVLVALGIIALFVWPGFVRQSTVPAATPNNINVTLPQTTIPGTDAGSNTDGSGGTQTTPGSGSTMPAQ